MPKVTPETAKRESGDGVDDPCGAFEALLISDSAGLTQFGAFVETLPPGSASSLKHWHAGEDEMIYMLSGQAVVQEGDESYSLHPGQAAVFKAGTPAGHCLTNTSDHPVSYLVIGTRSAGDVVTYPDHDRILRFQRDEDGQISREFTTLDGKPAGRPGQS